MHISTPILKRVAALLGTTILATGCAATQKAETAIGENAGTAQTMMARAQNPERVTPVSPLRVREQPWFGDAGIRQVRGTPLPPKFNRMTFVTAVPLTLDQMASELSLVTGIPFQIEDGVLESISERRARLGSGGGGGQQATFATTVPTLTASDREFMELNWENKSLTALLDLIGTRFNVGWRYTGERIVVYRYETRTFTVQALAVQGDVRMQVGDTSGRITSGAGQTNSTTIGAQQASGTAQVRVWDELEKGVKSIVGEDGEVTVQPSVGTITIKARPHVMERAANYIKEQNERVTRQVAIEVRILNVSVGDRDDYSLDWGSFWNTLGSRATLGLASAGNSATSGTTTRNFVDSFTGRDAGTVFGGALRSLSGRSGASVMVEALSRLGNVSTITSANYVAINNHVTPIGNTRDTSYLGRVSSITNDSNATVTLEPETITTGFRMTALPRILDGGEMLLQVGVLLSELRELRSFSSGNQTIQLPDVDTRSFMQQAMLRSGETLVLTGFNQDTSSAARRGVGSAAFPLLGGGVNARNQRDTVVILITPKILDNDSPPFAEARR